MALLFGRKTAGTTFKSMNYARGLVVGLFLTSWAFSVIAALLIQNNNWNGLACELSIDSCIALYAFSKIIIYLFLMEKVYVVTAVGQTRSNFFLYKVNAALMLPYFGVITCMSVFRIAKVRDDSGECRIGLEYGGALPLVLYDIFMSCWLTFLFMKSLLSSTSLLQGPSKGKLRSVARRTLIGALVSLLLSSANIFSLVYNHDGERGLICLISCTVDVTLNAISIHWVTSRGGSSSRRTALSERAVADRRTRGLSVHGGVLSDKQVGPLESHVSVSVESYVEEYHQLHYGGTSSRY
ncbi:hypothetical protein BGX21_009218 [Mortierella sp. AD011]|nr:hypothetical protein BGX20_009778 [Mortierella sp. AD010]KAF9403852.1 hypothetical protein BGX21_009218 [Mortierella sp. AD011]